MPREDGWENTHRSLKAPARQEDETGARMSDEKVVRGSCCMWGWMQSKNMSLKAKRMRNDDKGKKVGRKRKEKERLGILRNMPEKAKHLQGFSKDKIGTA